MVSEGSLLSLSHVCLLKVFEELPHADRLRMSRVCRDMHALWLITVQTVCVNQQDLELYDDHPLTVYGNYKSMILGKIELDRDCACFLAAIPQLQQLTSIIIHEPLQLNNQALSLITTACPHLVCLEFNGSWGTGAAGSADYGFQVPHQQHTSLQHLKLLHNSRLSPQDLLLFLTAERYIDCHTTDIPSGDNNVQSCSNSSHQGMLPLQELLMAEAAAGLHLCTQHPAWLHLRTLELSGCTKLGGSLGFLALLPNLHTLMLHSCYKVTNQPLQAFSQAVLSSSSSSSNISVHGSTNHSQCTDMLTGVLSTAAAPSPVLQAVNRATLRKLDLSYTRVNDDGMRYLAAALLQLQWLSLKGCNVGDNGLQHLLQLQQLTALLIKHCHRVTEEGVQQLSVLSNLRELSFGYTSLPEADDIAAAIANQFKQLTALDLLSSELRDRGLAEIGSLPQLQQLKLYQAGVTADAFRQLGEQRAGQRLTALVLYGLGGLSQLECWLAHCRAKAAVGWLM